MTILEFSVLVWAGGLIAGFLARRPGWGNIVRTSLLADALLRVADRQNGACRFQNDVKGRPGSEVPGEV